MAEIGDYQTVAAALADTAARRPDAIAYIDGNRSFTFAQIEQTSARLACGLLKLGCVRGDRVGVMALNQIEWVQLFFDRRSDRRGRRGPERALPGPRNRVHGQR